VIAFITLALALIALFAYPRYRAARELADRKRQIAEALAKDAAFTETLLKMELESTGVTYKELFDFCDKSIDRRNILIVEMRVDATVLAPNTNAALIGFLNAENGFARAKRALLSASLELETSKRIRNDRTAGFWAALSRSKEETKRRHMDEAGADLAESKRYLDTLPLSTANVQEAARTAAASVSRFRSACEILNSNERELAAAMSGSGMPFRPVFAPYYQQSIAKANAAAARASSDYD
jgi:hypothetical protein